MYAQEHTLPLVGYACLSDWAWWGVGGGEGTMDVQNKSPYNCSRKQIYSETEHFNVTKQCDNVSVHHNRHQAHLLPKFKVNFRNKCA